MLKQPTALRPFVGHFIVLVLIAVSTGYYDIVRSIAPASTERHNMIRMPLIAQLGAAVITLSLLSPVLLFQIVFCIRALRSNLSRPPFRFLRTMRQRMQSSPVSNCPNVLTPMLSIITLAVLSIALFIRVMPTAAIAAAMVSIPRMPFVRRLSIGFGILFPTRAHEFCVATFAKGIDLKRHILPLAHFLKGLVFVAVSAVSVGERNVEHSLFTSSRLPGERRRTAVKTVFSGATLADKLIVPQNGAARHAF